MRVVQIRKLNTQELFQRNNELIVQKIISRDFGSKVEKTRQYDEAFQRPINRRFNNNINNIFNLNNK